MTGVGVCIETTAVAVHGGGSLHVRWSEGGRWPLAMGSAEEIRFFAGLRMTGWGSLEWLIEKNGETLGAASPTGRGRRRRPEAYV